MYYAEIDQLVVLLPWMSRFVSLRKCLIDLNVLKGIIFLILVPFSKLRSKASPSGCGEKAFSAFAKVRREVLRKSWDTKLRLGRPNNWDPRNWCTFLSEMSVGRETFLWVWQQQPVLFARLLSWFLASSHLKNNKLSTSKAKMEEKRQWCSK